MSIEKNSDLDFDSDNSIMDKTYYPSAPEICNVASMDSIYSANISQISCTNYDEISSNLDNISSDGFHCTSSDSIPLILNGKYFTITQKLSLTEHQKSANGILAACQFCENKKPMKGSLRVTSNFVQHLKIKHKLQYDEYVSYKEGRKRRKLSCDKQSQFDEKVLKFVVDTFSPLEIVENPSFINLFDSGLKVMSLRALTNLLDTKHSTLLRNIKEYLKTRNYVCTTADVWSGGKRSFFGYTCHWIENSFTRKSVALACRRFSGIQSFNRIADLIHSLNRQFDLNENKIVCTITDNGSNFVKAFKEFGIKKNYEINNDGELSSDSDEDDAFSLDIFSPLLPKHFRCFTHTLNLLANTDFQNCLKKNVESYERHKCSLARCEGVWNKCNRPKTADIIKNRLYCALKTPVSTRWNSLYDSIKHLLEHKSKLDMLFKELNLENFSFSESAYLEEYCIFMQPIAEGIDFLQREKNNFFGYLLPTLISIKVKLEKVQYSGKLNYLLSITENMQTALMSRFQNYFKGSAESYDAIIASVTCPDIKLKFLPVLAETAPHVTENFIKDIFIKYVKKLQILGDDELNESPKPHIVQQVVPSFFDFGDRVRINENSHFRDPNVVCRRELNTYLEDTDSTLSCLELYPTVKKMFFYFNTPLASSAPVERLFSFAGIVNDQGIQKLTDSHFEKLVIARANKSF